MASLTLTLEVDWQVGGAVDNCRIAVFSPKGLVKKAEHTLGDNGHFGTAASGTEVFEFQIDPDGGGTFYAVIYGMQTAAAGLNNRNRQPRPILQKGLSRLVAAVIILEPNGEPPNDNQFVFDTAPPPGR